MRIDPQVERPTRDLLNHAMKGELPELPRIVRELGDDRRVRECLELCVLIAGYVTVDVCGAEWPTEASLRKISGNVARAETRSTLDEAEIYAFLERNALRFEPLNDVFATPDDATLTPFLITASLLVTYGPRDKGVWEYLDDAEEALEASANAKPGLLPAMILRAHMPAAERDR
jgi:hypothetical protein